MEIELSPEVRIAQLAYDSAHSRETGADGAALSRQASDLLRTGSANDSELDRKVIANLIEQGVLADVLVDNWKKVAGIDGDERTISSNDLTLAQVSRDADPMARMLATAIDFNRGEIHGTGPQEMGNYGYTQITLDDAQKADRDKSGQRPGGDTNLPVAVNQFSAGVLNVPNPFEGVNRSDIGVLNPDISPFPTDSNYYQFAGRMDQPATADNISQPGIAALDGYSPQSAAALAKLQSENISPEERLKAVSTLVADGHTTVPIRDRDGTTMNVRLEVSPISQGSSKSYVHMFAVDPNTGKETVMMRAITDGTNFFSQKDANGNDVGFFGTKWMRNNANSIFRSA